MKLLSSIAFAALLVPASPGLASAPDSRSFTDTAISSSLPAAPQFHGGTAGLTTLSAYDLGALAGTGAATDFACGFAAGAGLVMTLSGVAAPVGITLATVGFACALFS